LTPEVTLRPATIADAPCLGALATQVFLHTYAQEGIRPTLVREVRHNFAPEVIEALLRQPDTSVIVAEAAQHLLGFVQLRRGAIHPLVQADSAIELQRIYVLAHWQGKGVGRLLLNHAETLADGQGARALWLTAWVANAQALAFYAHQGYTDIGATTYRFEDESFENRVLVRQLGVATP